MAYKMMLLHFAVYCILQGSSEVVPEIAYEIMKHGTEWSVYPRNQIPERPKQIDTFVLMEGKAARIAVYNKSIPNVNSMSILILNNGQNIPTGPIQCESGSSSKCYIQINEIRMSMGGRWEILIHSNNFIYSEVPKILKVHLRPSKTPRILLGKQKFPTHIANYTIKPFDAFGCLVYNDDQFIDMTCVPSMENPKTTEWKAKGIQNIGTIKKYQASYRNNLTPEHDGAQIDCIEKYEYGDFYTNYEDWITVRVFFIHHGSTSVANDSNFYNVKPISNDDEEGCIKYVNCLYDPDVINQRDKYCVNTIPTVNNISVSTIVIVTVAAVIGIVAIIVLILCVRRKNKKVVRRNKDSTLNSVSYSHTSRQNLSTQSNHSDHLYCYIDVNSVQQPKTVPNLRIKPPARPPRAERRRNDEKSVDHSNKHVETGPRCNLAEISAEQSYPNGVDEAEDAYSYAYADRFDILSALRSQEEAR